MAGTHAEILPLKFGYHKQNIPFILTVTALVMMAIFVVAHHRKQTEKKKQAATQPAVAAPSPDQRLEKFSLSGFDEKGRRFWKLEGETAKIDRAETVYLEENVTLRLRDDTVIRTDKVLWAQGKGTLRTDSAVHVDHASAKINGSGAYGEPARNFVQLNKDIMMTLDDRTTITCDGPMKIYYNENKTVFYRNVKVSDQRGFLTAKRMEVFFDNEKKKVTEIIAIGDVKIERGSDTTRSKRAVYTPETGSLRLEGSPEITLHKGSASLLDAPLRN